MLDRILGQFEDFCIVTQSIRAAVPVDVRVLDKAFQITPTLKVNLDAVARETAQLGEAAIKLAREQIIDAEKLHSKSKNSPFDQRKVQGRIERTIVSGRCVYTFGD